MINLIRNTSLISEFFRFNVEGLYPRRISPQRNSLFLTGPARGSLSSDPVGIIQSPLLRTGTVSFSILLVPILTLIEFSFPVLLIVLCELVFVASWIIFSPPSTSRTRLFSVVSGILTGILSNTVFVASSILSVIFRDTRHTFRVISIGGGSVRSKLRQGLLNTAGITNLGSHGDIYAGCAYGYRNP
jgi:hypothetical protein